MKLYNFTNLPTNFVFLHRFILKNKALHIENASLTLCFWSLEPEKLERRIKGNAEVDATGRYILSRWCAEAYTPLAHRYGSIIYQRRGCQFCSVYSTGFLRTSTTDRQKPNTPLFFCSDGIFSNRLFLGVWQISQNET